jgi:hypothetical protein
MTPAGRMLQSSSVGEGERSPCQRLTASAPDTTAPGRGGARYRRCRREAGRALRLLWITPPAGRTSPICVRMFEVGATMMSVTIRNTVPVPIAPVVLPVDAVPAPAAGMVNQFDERCRANLDRAMVRCERGRLSRYRQGQAQGKRQDYCAHFCLSPQRSLNEQGSAMATNKS